MKLKRDFVLDPSLVLKQFKRDWNSQELLDLYHSQGLSLSQIATLKGCSHAAVFKAMQKFSIPRRKCGSSHPLEKHPFWKGGIAKAREYLKEKAPNHPRTNSAGYVLQHILVWEQIHQRQLPVGWAIHHLNGVKNDNRSENLAAMPVRKHSFLTQNEPYKKHIRELEVKVNLLEQSLRDSQLIFGIGEN